MGMYKNKKHVTLNTLLQPLKERVATRTLQWKWAKATLHRFLTNIMHYCYTDKKSHYESIRENVAIAEQCVIYLKQIKAYRHKKRAIYYQDETWVNKNMTPLRSWLDENREGGTPSLPQGKGSRSIISHIGSNNSFLEGARLIHRDKML